jgi:Asp/Glu/hydantoin racemase
VCAVTPIHVDAAELDRRRERYRHIAPDGMEVSVRNLPADPDVPRQLGTPQDIAASEAFVLAELGRLDPGEFDAALPDCVLDPGVAGRDHVAVAVHGITELAAGVVASLGGAFTAVARNRAIAEELDAVITRYGYRDFTPTRVLDLSFEAIADHGRWNDAVTELTADLAQTPVRRVLNGCSAVDVRADASRVTVFDPTLLALDALALASRHGLLARAEEAPHA